MCSFTAVSLYMLRDSPPFSCFREPLIVSAVLWLVFSVTYLEQGFFFSRIVLGESTPNFLVGLIIFLFFFYLPSCEICEYHTALNYSTQFIQINSKEKCRLSKACKLFPASFVFDDGAKVH